MDKTLLEQKISEWNKACEFFECPDVQLLLTDEERDAVSFLIGFWKNCEFDKEACAQRIEILKQNDVNHGPHRDVIEKSKSLRGIAATFYTKDANLYGEFRMALGWSPRPQANPQTESIPTPAFDEVLVMSYVEKWSKAIQYLKREDVLPFLEADEQTAIELLADMWRRPTFQSTMTEEAAEMINVLVAAHRMHSSNREIIEQSKSLCGVARKIYSNEEVFYAFKKSLNQYYKEHKPPRKIPAPSPMPPQKDKDIIIKDVLFANQTYEGNIIKDYGKILYSNTQYIVPRFILSSNYWGDEEIEVILGYPNGKTASYKSKVSFEGRGTYTLSGWGNEKGRSYESFDYVFYTFKCQNKIIWQGNVIIQKDPDSPEYPVIKSVLFGATDSRGELVIPFGAAIPTGIAYLKPQIVVDNNFYGTITIDVEYKFEKRDTVHFKSAVDINGPGNYTLLSWGNDNYSYYSKSELITCTLRYKGVTLYSTTVQVGKNKKKLIEDIKTNNSKWGRLNSKISYLGLCFYEQYEDPENFIGLISLLLFVVYGIVIIVTWINETFFSALMTGVVGLIIIGLIGWAIKKVSKILFFILSLIFFNIWSLLATIVVSIAILVASIWK